MKKSKGASMFNTYYMQLRLERSDFVNRNDELTRILERVVEIGLRGGWAEFKDTPLSLPLIQLAPPRSRRPTAEEPNSTSFVATDAERPSTESPS